MLPSALAPSLELLKQEYVLIQAWKKTAAHLRAHNWYCDTLEVDWTTVNLRRFIKRIQRDLENPDGWTSDPLRVVWAPKSQEWCTSENSWSPKEGVEESRLRPLAHVSLRDQVVATGLMLCLANRIETLQRDPRRLPTDLDSLADCATSYGNRLFCDRIGPELRHRWGSKRLYRSFFTDYRSFVRRPSKVAESWKRKDDYRVFVVELDLAQFYDRVRPDFLADALDSFSLPTDDHEFFNFTRRVLQWQWDDRDMGKIGTYERAADLRLSDVALPQGLVAAGFFANIALMGVDDRLREDIGREVAPGMRIRDIVRYVDDLRVVVTVQAPNLRKTVERQVTDWIKEVLDMRAPDLGIARHKTRAAEFQGSERPILFQSLKMERIQRTFSGGFDLLAAEEILQEVRGLLRSQFDMNQDTQAGKWGFSPRSDIRDETIARFAAWRYRRTYRSMRPLLDDAEESEEKTGSAADLQQRADYRAIRTKREWDNDARVFAFQLVKRWLDDPSNVRLLRIAMDLWPEPTLLSEILRRLRKCVRGSTSSLDHDVACYCLAELFLAGATETGLVDDDEQLADGLDLAEYRNVLGEEALSVVLLSTRVIPWYVRQQAFLFLAVWDPGAIDLNNARRANSNNYWKLIRFLKGERSKLSAADVGTLAVIASGCLSNEGWREGLEANPLNRMERRGIAVRDPSLAMRLYQANRDFFAGARGILRSVARDLCVRPPPVTEGHRTLADVVLKDGPTNVLRNELSLLHFASKMLEQKDDWAKYDIIDPGQVALRLSSAGDRVQIHDIHVSPRHLDSKVSIYDPPSWCDKVERWRFQLGYLMRFILAGHRDFTGRVQRPTSGARVPRYKPARNVWYSRLYGMSTSRQSFGDDWLPISEWMESFLLALLRWPGCHVGVDFEWVGSDASDVHDGIGQRVSLLSSKLRREATPLILPTKSVTYRKSSPFRICVVQTVVPDQNDIERLGQDPTLSARQIRKKHRHHLSKAIESVKRSLDLRKTHMSGDGTLDLLVLPELSVHPLDLRTHIVPFVRQYKAIVLAGLTYQEVLPGQGLVNSAMWLIPGRAGTGMQIRTWRQGKRWPARGEPIEPFRPCQWVLEHSWKDGQSPLRLTASLCYDATDLGLVSDLRDEVDAYFIPAYNRDVATFDQMSRALHYHMYQMVVVANNGQYGGSSAYWPKRGTHQKQIFHLYGQPQASIAFLEIEDIPGFLGRVASGRQSAGTRPGPERKIWKYPPAGM